jgi:hypothetical protein
VKHARGRPEAPNSYSLTSWPELIVVIHGEYMSPGTHAVNLLEGYVTCTTDSTHHQFEWQWYHWGRNRWRTSDELTIISTGSSEESVSTDGSHSSKVRPEASSSTRCRHTSTTRVSHRSTNWFYPSILSVLCLLWDSLHSFCVMWNSTLCWSVRQFLISSSASLKRLTILVFVYASFYLRFDIASLTSSVRPSVLINTTSISTVRTRWDKLKINYRLARKTCTDFNTFALCKMTICHQERFFTVSPPAPSTCDGYPQKRTIL